MRRTLIIITFLCLSRIGGDIQNACAQSADLRRSAASEEQELETDRDAFTPANVTVGRRLTIVESSYSFIDNRSAAETHSLPELLVRYGVSERIELRVGWNYEVGGAGDVVGGEEGGGVFEASGLERESQLLYGIKAQMTEQNGWVPRSAAILQGYTPTSGESPATDYVAAYLWGWELPNRWRLDSAMRYGTDHDVHDVFNLWVPSIVLRVPLDERWHVHAEYFAEYSQGAEQEFSEAFFSSGTSYLFTKNLELGLRLGWGLTDDAPNFFSNVGVGWRF